MNDLISRQPEITKRTAETEQNVMNGELISRKATIDGTKKIPDLSVYAYCSFLDMLFKLPSVPERKKGRWVHDGFEFPGGVDWIHCSECGKRGINVPADLTNYCPCCGAKMEGAEDDKG